MDTPSDKVMKRAVRLARSGRYSGWWAIKVALLAEGHSQAPGLMASEWKRNWIDLVCWEARASQRAAASQPTLPSTHQQN